MKSSPFLQMNEGNHSLEETTFWMLCNEAHVPRVSVSRIPMRTGTAVTQVWRILQQWLVSVSLPENTKPFTSRSHQPHTFVNYCSHGYKYCYHCSLV